MRLPSSRRGSLLALPLLGLAACSSAIDVSNNASGSGGASSSADACRTTADSISFALTTYDGKKLPTTPGPQAPPVVIEGRVTKYDANAKVIEVDSCAPSANCSPMSSRFEILGAKGSFYPSMAPGSFLRIEASGDLSGWQIQIKSIATWDGLANPSGPNENLVFAAFMGESNGTPGVDVQFAPLFDDSPFQVSLKSLPCAPASTGPTPGYQPFMLQFDGPTLKSPVDVHMGDASVVAPTTDNQYWQFDDLQSAELPAGVPADGPDQYWVTYFIHNTIPGG
jgi:hypothetical protein